METMQPPTSHYLLPHERWFVRSTLERQRTHRTPAVVRMENRLGPEGVTLYLAALATILPGYVTALAGFALVIAAWRYLSLLNIGIWIMLGGCALSAPGVFRALQARRAGQAFRDTRSQDSGPTQP
jgi:UPF0716 family protein affecting phage T7 exclusion